MPPRGYRPTRSTGGLFNLSGLRAKTKTKRVLIRELLYADDAALVAHSEMHLQNLCERFAKACSNFIMTINLKKTVVISLGTSIPPRILINGSLQNVVDKFSYLGSVVNSSKNLDNEINQCFGNASTNFGRLSSRVWKNHHLAIKLKIKVHTAYMLSVLLYSSGAHTAAKAVYFNSDAFFFNSDAFVPFLVSRGGIMSPTPPSCISPVHMTSPQSWGSNVCAG